MGSDAKNAAEPVSIDPGKLLRLAVEQELATAPEDALGVAGGRSDGAFRKRLETTLKAWQGSEEDQITGLPYVSFATAFPISRKTIAGEPINPLKQPKNPEKQTIYTDVFEELTKSPGIPNYGKWPWDMIRQELPNYMTGAFPPCFILIADPDQKEMAIPSLVGSYENIFSFAHPGSLPQANEHVVQLQKEIASTAKVGKDRKCWETYAVIPSLVADDLRDGGKKTRALIYVLGTRREFATRWHDSDWGMIVGLTADVRDAKPDVQCAIIDAVLASWNLLAAAPFAIAQSTRISELDAQQKATHIFKTEAQILLNRLQNAGQDANRRLEQAIEDAKGFLGLVHLSHFLSKGGLKSPEFTDKDRTEAISAIRPQDWEEYDIVTELKGYFEGSPFGVSFTFTRTYTPVNMKGKWVSKRYLFAVLNELVDNIAQEQTRTADCTIKIESDTLTISICNPIERQAGEEAWKLQSQRGPRGYDLPTGEAAAKAFFSCLGGDHKGEVVPEQNGTEKKWFYQTTCSYDLKDWKEKLEIAERSRNGDKLGDTKDSTDKTSRWGSQVSKVSPQKVPPEQPPPSIRVLLLDDYMAEPQAAKDGFSGCFTYDPTQKFALKEYIRPFPSGENSKDAPKEFFCLALYKEAEFLGLEIVLCTRLRDARDYLAKEHFDILLIDVDFGREAGAPPLGGILFALIPRPDSAIRIMTAVDSTLRLNNRDYSYIMSLQEKQGDDGRSVLKHLRIETEDTSKDLTIQLRLAFQQWLDYVFPQRTDPVSRYLWTRWLNVSRSNPKNEVNDARILPVGGANPDSVVLKGELLQAVHPMSVPEYNSKNEPNKEVIFLRNHLLSRWPSLPTAINSHFDGSDNHDYKSDLLKKYANEKTLISQHAREIWDSGWGKRLDILLKDSLPIGPHFETAKQGLREKILACKDKDLNAIFRCDVHYPGIDSECVSAKIYGLPPDLNACKENIKALLGNEIHACKIEFGVDAKPRKIWYVGLFLAGTAAAQPDPGAGHRDSLQVLEKYMSIANLCTVGDKTNKAILTNLDHKVMEDIKKTALWKSQDYKGKTGLVWLMMQHRRVK